MADALYQRYVELLRGKGLQVETGVFQAMMEVELVNDGPVTILLDSKRLF
jgi:D-tyrosyl-tRNA(Tyr) deacylase